MITTVSQVLAREHGIDASPGRKVECPFCGRRTFSIKSDDSVGKCFHPSCNESLVATNRKEKDGSPRNIRATVQPQGGLTLQQYSDCKRLPIDFLRVLNLSERRFGGCPSIRIPYLDASGDEVAVRYRLALEKTAQGDNRFRWKRGTKPCPYGLWLLKDAYHQGFVILCEGESDAQTLILNGFPALGLPGANSWKDDWAEHLDGIAVIYVLIEPDAGGEAVRRWLETSSIRNRVRLIELGNAKDVSELFCLDPATFPVAMKSAMKASVSFIEAQREEEQKRRQAAWRRCEPLATKTNILDEFAQDVARRGLIGEEKAARLVYLVTTTRLLDDPVSVAVKGPSSCGKSFLVKRVLEFFPDAAYFALSAMSERSLAYSEEPLSHRMLVLYEMAGVNTDLGTYLLRSLLSEGHIRYETVDKTKDGLVSRLIERPGPTGLIATTTVVELHPENETRLLSIPVTDDAEQTRAVLIEMTRTRTNPVDLEAWISLQEWLALGNRSVRIPFAGSIAEQVRPSAVRLRRDFATVLNLIRAHALLHQATRQRDEEGRVIASMEDYEAVRKVVSDFVAGGIGASIPDTVRETVEVVRDLTGDDDEGVSVNAVADRLGLDKSAASRRVRQARRGGYLVNKEERRGRPARLVLGDPLPEETTFLPPAGELRCCTVAPDSEGDNGLNYGDRKTD